MASKPKKSLSQVMSDMKAKQTSVRDSVSNAGVLGMLKREANSKFKRGNTSVPSI